MSNFEFSAGQSIVALYQGQDNKEGPKTYRGVIEDIKTPKNGGHKFLVVKLADGTYRSLYPHKAHSIEVVG